MVKGGLLMKKTLVVVSVLLILAVGMFAFIHFYSNGSRTSYESGQTGAGNNSFGPAPDGAPPPEGGPPPGEM